MWHGCGLSHRYDPCLISMLVILLRIHYQKAMRSRWIFVTATGSPADYRCSSVVMRFLDSHVCPKMKIPVAKCSQNLGLLFPSFPGRFGREKWPGNFREFKLLLPLPESWKTQSDFRSLSHDNSKPNCVMS